MHRHFQSNGSTGMVAFIHNVCCEVFFNNWKQNTREFIKSSVDESFHVVARKRSKEKRKSSNVDVLAEKMGSTSNEEESTSDNAGVDIDWMAADNSTDIRAP